MAWMVAFATNRLALDPGIDSGPSLAFVAHQWNGPVWEAIDRGEMDGFDSTPRFWELANQLVQASGEKVLFRCPFLYNRMNRSDIVELAVEIGVPLLETSSCILGWGKDCQKCHSCMLRRAAFVEHGVIK
jgi:7-cyano-7-deazaguanine synthase in queuosine biosynthesis